MLDIPDEELWAARQALRNYLFAFIRERARQRWTDEHVSAARVVAAGTLLDPNALTIGFARRFTGYKRPELIFHDPNGSPHPERRRRRPVQIVFAGKAHPADDTGKHHLQQVYRRAIDPMFGGRIAFVDDYDLHVAHFLVQGCDVWLNNPRKPLEASGTSGMKASHQRRAAPEHRRRLVGRGLHRHERLAHRAGEPEHGDPDAVDAADAEALYSCSSARSCRRSTIATQRRPAPLARDRQGSDPHRRAAVLRAPHGQGIRRGGCTAAAAPAQRRGPVQPADALGSTGCPARP